MLSKGQDETLTPSQQRRLAVGLLVFVVLLVVLLIITPIISKSLTLSETRNNLLFKLQKYERILAKKDTVLASMEKMKQQSIEQHYFNGQKTEALASAEMQAFIKKTIADAGGQLNSTETISSSGKSNTTRFDQIIVRISMTGNSETLRAVLYKIENSVPLTIIDQIDMRPTRGRRNRQTGQIDPSNNLNINFRAISFMRKTSQ